MYSRSSVIVLIGDSGILLALTAILGLVVSILNRNDHIVVLVKDDGVRFNPSRSAGGLGLPGIRERVEAHGGSVRILSTVNSGTANKVQIPVGVAA